VINDAKSKKKLRLLHITDSHLNDSAVVNRIDIKTKIDGVENPLRTDVLRETIKSFAKDLKATGDQLDAVIVSGDSTLKGNSEGQIVLRDMLLEYLADSGITSSRIIATPGNHDVISGSEPSTAKRYQLFSDAWMKPTPAIIPFLDGIHDVENLNTDSHVLVDENKNWAIFPINSANWSQLSLSRDQNPHVGILLDHLKSVGDVGLDSALAKLLSYDIARVSVFQLQALRKLVEAVGNVKLKIAVIHHHLLPVGNEEFKPFADITNLGLLRQVLMQLGFDMVIHGHKHTDAVYYDHIYKVNIPNSLAHRVLTVSGGTYGHNHDSPLRLIEINDIPSAPTCTLHIMASAEAGLAPKISISHPYPMWEDDQFKDGPVCLAGRSIDDLYARAISTLKTRPNQTIICTIEFENDVSLPFPLSYPHVGDEKEMEEWFEETVKWWQNSTSRSEQRMPYIHGTRLKRFGGGLDQIERVIQLLRTGQYTSRALALVIDPTRDFHGEKTFASFCLIQFCLKKTDKGDQLDCIGYYRAQEFNHWWPVNIAELRYLQLEVIKGASTTPGKILPGKITTISPYPRLSDDIRQPTKVAVPLVDQWLDNHPIRIAQMALAIANNPLDLESDPGTVYWKRCLNDLEQAASVHHTDGVPIAIEGLELLKDWVKATNPMSPTIPLIENLILANFGMPENPKRSEFDRWSNQVNKIILELRTATKLNFLK